MQELPHHFHPSLASLIESIPPGSNARRTVHTDDQMRVTLFGFAARQELTGHTAANPPLGRVG